MPVETDTPLPRAAKPVRKGYIFGQIYPWAEWFAQLNFTAVRGKDYFVRPDTFCQTVRNMARRHHVRVNIKVGKDESTVMVVVTPKKGVTGAECFFGT